MKAIPKVNKEGLYLEDALVDDAFSGVVPFYAELSVPELPLITDAENERPAKQEPEIAGYMVGLPVTPGLYLPRFDIAAWKSYQDNLVFAQEEYNMAYAEWSSFPEEGRGEPPIHQLLTQPEFWLEGLTAEEIEALHPPMQPTELERLQQENMELKLAIAELAEANETDKTQMQLALAELAEWVAVH